MDQLEGSLLSEKSAVEERAAQSAAEPLKRCLERKETALRSMKLKLEAVQAELSGSRAELEGAKAEVTKREVRARKQSETALAALSVQLDRAHTDREELRLLIHQIAHAIEQKRTSRGAAEAAGQRRAVAPVENEQFASLGRLNQRWHRLAVDGDVEQRRLRCDVVVPQIMARGLERPAYVARCRIQSHDRTAEFPGRG